MKVLGRVENSDSLIVELTHKEAVAIAMLQDAIKGKTWDWSIRRNFPQDTDIDEWLMAVFHFVEANLQLNNLSELLKKFTEIVYGKAEKDTGAL